MAYSYRSLIGSVSSTGVHPKPAWNRIANELRVRDLTRQAGTFAGHLVASQTLVNAEMLAMSGRNFAEAIQPPLSPGDRQLFQLGFDEAVMINAMMGEM